MNHLSKKISAAVLSAVFFLTSGPLGYSFEINQYLHSRPQAPVSQKVIYFIHDIHAQKEAQLSVGSLIKDLQSKGPIGFIGLEGLNGPVALDGLRNYPHHQILKAVADFFLERNQISGPIHQALLSKEPLPPIYGIEDSAAYAAHVRTYKNAEPLMKDLKKELRAIQNELNSKEATVFNPELKRFHGMVRAYNESGRSLLGYLEGFATFPITVPEKLKLYTKVLGIEKNLVMSKVQSEKNKFISALTRTLSPAEQQALLKASQNLREGRVSNTEFFGDLARLAHAKRVDVSGYPHLARYFEYVELMGRIDAQKLPDDISSFEKSTYATLIKNDQERRLVERERYIALALKLVNFSLTPGDWLEYQNLKSRQSVGERNFLLSYFENFYHLAHRRDNTLAANILRTINATNAETGVVVIGGFHFQGVRQVLESKNIRMVSVLPSISADMLTSESPDYLRQLSTNRSLLDRVLSGAVWTLSLQPNRGVGNMPGALMAATMLLPGTGQVPGQNAQLRALGMPQDARITTSRPSVNTGQAVITVPGQGQVTFTAEKVDGNANDESLKINVLRGWRAFGRLGDVLRSTVAQLGLGYNRVLGLISRVAGWSVSSWKNWKPQILAVPLGVFLALPGCVAPDQISHEFKTPTPAEWVNGDRALGTFQDGWSKYFPDQQLADQIKAALEKNYALLAFDSRANLQALAESAGYARWPQADVSVGADVANGFDGINNFGGTASMKRQAVGNISWDADIFGRLSSAAKAAKLSVDVAQYQYDSAVQELVSLVTITYFEIKELDDREELLVGHIGKLKELVELLNKRTNTKVAYNSSVSAVAEAESQLIQLRQQKREKIMELQVLTSSYSSGTIKDFTIGDLPAAPDVARIPFGSPFDLFDRLPAIKAAKTTADALYQGVLSANADRKPLLSFGAGANLTKIFAKAGFDKLYSNSADDPPAQAFWGAGVLLQGFLDPFIFWGQRKAAEDYAVQNEGTAVMTLFDVTLKAFKRVEVDLSRTTTSEQVRAKISEAIAAKQKAVQGQTDLVQTGDDDGRKLLEEQLGIYRLRVLELQNRLFQLVTFVDLMTALGGNWEAKPTEENGKDQTPPANSMRPRTNPSAGENKGGSIFASPYYVAHLAKWETPVFYALIAPVVALTAAYLSTGVLAITNAGLLWGLVLTPILFMVAHRGRMLTTDVVKLTVLKTAVSAIGIGLVIAQVPAEANVPILGVLVAALTYYHGQIQNAVVAQLRASMGRFVLNSQAVLLSVRDGQIPGDVVSIQVAMQETAATQRAATLRADMTPSDTRKALLMTTLIDSGATDAQISELVKQAFSVDKNPKTLRQFITNGPGLETKINREIARYKSDVGVIVNPTLFDATNDGVLQLSLARLEAFQLSQGLLDNGPALRILARSGLALTGQDTLTTQSFREALIFSLTKNMALAPFTMGNLDTIINAARQAAVAA